MYESNAESLRQLKAPTDAASLDDYPLGSLARDDSQRDPYGNALKTQSMLAQAWGYPIEAVRCSAATDYPVNSQSRFLGTSENFNADNVEQCYWGQRDQLKRPLRVIHVGQYMFLAGIESWLRSLIRYTDRSKVEIVRCVVTGDVHDCRVIRSMGVQVEVGRAAAVQQAARDCDVLLFSGPADLKALLGDVRPPVTVFVAHGDAVWTQNILTSTRDLIDHCVAVSKMVDNRICGGLPSTVIHNCVDPAHVIVREPRGDVRRRHGFSEDDFVLGYVGRFSSEKRVELLVQALKLLPKNFKLLLVGWGALKQKLMHLANELIPGRYAFATAETDLGSYYSAMDVHCMVSESEGFGLSMVESMFCGVPLLCTSIGFVPEKLTNRVNCAIVDPTAESICETAQLLLDYPQWRNAIAIGGRQAVEAFAYPQHMCRQYEATLRNVWNNKMQVR